MGQIIITRATKDDYYKLPGGGIEGDEGSRPGSGLRSDGGNEMQGGL
jgi:hypothetical protein